MDETNTNITEKLFKAVGLMHRFHHSMNKEHGPVANPHRGQGRILALLKMQPEISQKDLGYLLDMKAQSLGELLMKLEKGGFITRNPSQGDRRVMNIKITEQGLKAANSPAREQGEDMLGFLSGGEKEALNALLDKVIEGLCKTMGIEEADCGFDFNKRLEALRGVFEQGHGHGGFGKGCMHGHEEGGAPRGFGHGEMPFSPHELHERIEALRAAFGRHEKRGTQRHRGRHQEHRARHEEEPRNDFKRGTQRSEE